MDRKNEWGACSVFGVLGFLEIFLSNIFCNKNGVSANTSVRLLCNKN